MRLLLGLALLLPFPAWAQVRPACTDLSLEECRKAFVNANLPHPNKIDRNSALLDPIRDALRRAKSASDQVKLIEAEIARMESVLIGENRDAQGDIHSSVENILANRKLLADAVKQKYEFRNLAIERTKIIYGLTPGVTVAPPHDPGMPGSVAIRPWNPRYSENQELDDFGHGRLLNDQEKLDLARKAGSPPGSMMDHDAGTSREDARIAIFPHAFERPEMLAALIMHETVHWLDRAARGTISLPFDSFTSEVKAYTLVANEAATFGLTPDDVRSMRNLATIYAKQAKLSQGLTWGQVENHHRDWMFSSSPSPDDDSAPPGRPEPTKELADTSFLDSWRQATGAIVDAKARQEELSRLDKERLEREREEQERANKERKERDFRDEMDAGAASCGYKIHYDADKAILGFIGIGDSMSYRLGSKYVPTDWGDIKVVFLMTRTCDTIQHHPHEPAPQACNGAADFLLRERISRGDFMPKIEFLAATWLWDGAWVRWDRCIQEILNNAERITDTKSFNVLMASFQERESKRLKEEANREREREKREKKRSPGGGDGGESRDPTGSASPATTAAAIA